MGTLLITMAVVAVLGFAAWRLMAAKKRRTARTAARAEKAARQEAEYNAKMQQFRELLAEARAGGREAIYVLTDKHDSKRWDLFASNAQGEYDNALEQGQFIADLARIQPLYDEWREAVGIDDELAALAKLHQGLKACYNDTARKAVCARLEVTVDTVVAEINAALASKLAELVANAEAGSLEAFVLADRLYADTHGYGRPYADSYPYYGIGGIRRLVRPQGWNELVDRYLRNPGYEQIDPDALRRQRNLPAFTPTEVAHMAADAAEDQRNQGAPFLAKVVVAMGSHDPDVRKMVGEILWAEMLCIIARSIAERAVAEEPQQAETTED